MLTFTKEAARLVRTLTDRAALPHHGGLRIALDADTDSLSMSLTETPDPTDAVVTRDDALLFVSTAAAQRVRGLTLCAEVTETRSVFFLEAA